MNANICLISFFQEISKVLKEPKWAREKKGQEIFLAFFVLSANANRILRNRVRKQMMEVSDSLKKTEHANKAVTLTFLIGNTPNMTLKNELQKEFRIHQDFLWVNVMDAYVNLPNKTIVYYSWMLAKQRAMERNPLAGFKVTWLAKFDDDIPIKIEKLVNYLSNANPSQKTIHCNGVLRNTVPIRHPMSIQRKM